MKTQMIKSYPYSCHFNVPLERNGQQVFNFVLSTYRKVASSKMSRLEVHAGFFRLLMKGIFYPYVL